MSTQPAPKSTSQVRAIFGLSRKLGLADDLLRDAVESITGLRHISALTHSQADKVIDHLKAKAGQPTPRRTTHYRRAKAGINQVVQSGQLELIASLASQRNWSAEALGKFCVRQCKHFPLRTTADANKVIEALKSMNRREGKWSN